MYFTVFSYSCGTPHTTKQMQTIDIQVSNPPSKRKFDELNGVITSSADGVQVYHNNLVVASIDEGEVSFKNQRLIEVSGILLTADGAVEHEVGDDVVIDDLIRRRLTHQGYVDDAVSSVSYDTFDQSGLTGSIESSTVSWWQPYDPNLYPRGVAQFGDVYGILLHQNSEVYFFNSSGAATANEFGVSMLGLTGGVAAHIGLAYDDVSKTMWTYTGNSGGNILGHTLTNGTLTHTLPFAESLSAVGYANGNIYAVSNNTNKLSILTPTSASTYTTVYTDAVGSYPAIGGITYDSHFMWLVSTTGILHKVTVGGVLLLTLPAESYGAGAAVFGLNWDGTTMNLLQDVSGSANTLKRLHNSSYATRAYVEAKLSTPFNDGINISTVSGADTGTLAVSVNSSGIAKLDSSGEKIIINNNLELQNGRTGYNPILDVPTHAQITLGYADTGARPHYITSNHSGAATDNSIMFRTSPGGSDEQAGVFANSVLGLTVTNGQCLVKNPPSSDDSLCNRSYVDAKVDGTSDVSASEVVVRNIVTAAETLEPSTDISNLDSVLNIQANAANPAGSLLLMTSNGDNGKECQFRSVNSAPSTNAGAFSWSTYEGTTPSRLLRLTRLGTMDLFGDVLPNTTNTVSVGSPSKMLNSVTATTGEFNAIKLKTSAGVPTVVTLGTMYMTSSGVIRICTTAGTSVDEPVWSEVNVTVV